ncbi:hypothetical protein [Streptosporangium vulgare]|uniref:Uncharacterized protein n=1 Tax=Streptosporangium vulgare TaxID=46190 RepID=A0ABV5TNM7_9ACTN
MVLLLYDVPEPALAPLTYTTTVTSAALAGDAEKSIPSAAATVSHVMRTDLPIYFLP